MPGKVNFRGKFNSPNNIFTVKSLNIAQQEVASGYTFPLLQALLHHLHMYMYVGN